MPGGPQPPAAFQPGSHPPGVPGQYQVGPQVPFQPGDQPPFPPAQSPGAPQPGVPFPPPPPGAQQPGSAFPPPPPGGQPPFQPGQPPGAQPHGAFPPAPQPASAFPPGPPGRPSSQPAGPIPGQPIPGQPIPGQPLPGQPPQPPAALFSGSASVPAPSTQTPSPVGLPGYRPPHPPVQAPGHPEPAHQRPPVYGQPPVSGQPVSPRPVSSPPVSGQPQFGQPVSGQPLSSQVGSGHPVSSPPASLQPVSGQPVSGQPVSGQPVSGQPVSGPGSDPHAGEVTVRQAAVTTDSPGAGQWPPTQRSPAQQSTAQQRMPWTDPPAQEEGGAWQPRITPSPPRKPRLWLGLLIGVLVGLLVFGTAGFFVGRKTAEPEAQPTTTTPTQQTTGEMGAYQAGQLELNRTKFSGDLATIAEPWLAWMGGCSNSGDQFGPKLDPGEQTRVFCELNNLSVFFVQYKTIADRDTKRAAREKQNIDAQNLTQGAVAPSQKSTTSGKTTGNYIEYAYRNGTGNEARTTGGIWWEMDKAPVAAFIEVYWTDVGEKWEALRDVWQRYS